MAYLSRVSQFGSIKKIDTLIFNGSTTTFALKIGGVAYTPTSALALMVSVGGVIQEPNTDFNVSGSNIVFSVAPPSGETNFVVVLGMNLTVGGSLSTTDVRTEIQNQTAVTLSGVSGTNTITATAPQVISSYSNGQTFRFVVASSNTGAVTINIDGVGAKSITKAGTTPLEGGDLSAGAVVQITYDGTRFQLVSGAGGGGAVANSTMYLTGSTITSSYSIPSGKNALAVKSLSVATGQTLTVPTGSSLVVVGAGGQSGSPDAYVNIAGSQTITGAKNFTSAPTLNGSDLTSIGVGQTWQSFTVGTNRINGTTYTNTTGRPIMVFAQGYGLNGTVSLTVGGVSIPYVGSSNGTTGAYAAGAFIVPNGTTYVVNGAQAWMELR